MESRSARGAFAEGNVAKSKLAHEAKKQGVAGEEKPGEDKYLKSAIFGGVDGLTTSFAFISAAIASNSDIVQLCTLGVAQLLAGAIGMGVGEYLSCQTENEKAKWEQQRERWEVENNPTGEIEEMVDIYKGKGMAEEDARLVASTISKYEDFWVEHMMLHEIGMFPAEEGPSQSILRGFFMFLSFMLFGALPLATYISTSQSQTATLVVVVPCLFLLGALRTHAARWEKSVCAKFFGGFVILFQGLLCASIAYAIGYCLPTIIGSFRHDEVVSKTEL